MPFMKLWLGLALLSHAALALAQTPNACTDLPAQAEPGMVLRTERVAADSVRPAGVTAGGPLPCEWQDGRACGGGWQALSHWL